MDKLERFSKPVLRIVLGLVFLYFSFQQITNPGQWVGFIPSGVLGFGFSAEGLVMFNALFELVFGVLLLLGLFTRIVALILSLHLFVITFSIGFNPIGVRDFGLAFATFVVFLNGVDEFCLDKKMNK